MNNKKIYIVTQLIFMLWWLLEYLPKTDSNYVIYIICAIAGFIGISHKDSVSSKKHKNILRFVSSVFSIVVVLANWFLFKECVWAIIPMFIGGYFVAINALNFLYGKLVTYDIPESTIKKMHPECLFGISMLIITVIDCVYLFACAYPGNLSHDSIMQIMQILNNSYSNHHPFYHTMLIKICISIGLNVFGNINAAVAVYSVFQILFMAACFSFAIITLYQLNISLKWIAICFIWYAIMPYHIIYSITMWKDVMFGGGVLLFTVSLFRIWFEIGKNKKFNHVMFVVGCLCFCLLRSNGLISLAIATICMLLIFRGTYKKIYRILLITLGVSCLLTGPVLNYLGVKPTETVEALSIPLQQIARVVVDNEEITDEQKERIDNILDISQISEKYLPYISDPIKILFDSEYFSEHKREFFELWIELGIEHPETYVKAWIDQTKGYWNGGYSYWIYSHWLQENDFGIERTVVSGNMRNAMVAYSEYLQEDSIFGVFSGIGFHVWIVLLLSVLNFFRGDKKKFFLTLPVLCMIGTLLISTPVYSEFRYAYSVFTCVPFLTLMTFARATNMMLERKIS